MYLIDLINGEGLITSVCPCITFSQIAEIVDQGETCKWIDRSIYHELIKLAT